MGRGISLSLAQTGHQVVLVDVSSESLYESRQELKKYIRMQNLFQKNDELPHSGDVLNNITLYGTYLG